MVKPTQRLVGLVRRDEAVAITATHGSSKLVGFQPSVNGVFVASGVEDANLGVNFGRVDNGFKRTLVNVAKDIANILDVIIPDSGQELHSSVQGHAVGLQDESHAADVGLDGKRFLVASANRDTLRTAETPPVPRVVASGVRRSQDATLRVQTTASAVAVVVDIEVAPVSRVGTNTGGGRSRVSVGHAFVGRHVRVVTAVTSKVVEHVAVPTPRVPQAAISSRVTSLVGSQSTKTKKTGIIRSVVVVVVVGISDSSVPLSKTLLSAVVVVVKAVTVFHHERAVPVGGQTCRRTGLRSGQLKAQRGLNENNSKGKLHHRRHLDVDGQRD
mmetsp:Transcript_18545/g.35249  ORF Transcript_18545/g.35249 Transcript_18545/m.35249 type:complete len:328 (+) Transcript_18545:116-1099(+)